MMIPERTNGFIQITLIRHAQAVGNPEHLLLGQINVPLTPEGERQARENVPPLFEGRNITCLFASDTDRSIRTMIPLALQRGLLIIHDPLLRERAWGEFENVPVPKVEGYLHETVKALPNMTNVDKLLLDYGHGVEIAKYTVKRFDQFLTNLVARALPGEDFVVCSHGGLLGYWLIDKGYLNFDRITGASSNVRNGALVTLETNGSITNILTTHNINNLIKQPARRGI